jgi:transposase
VRASVNPERLRKYAANTAVWLFMRDPKTLEEREHEDLTLFCQASPALSRAYTLIQDFRDMLHRGEGARLDTWLEQVTGSDLPELQSFASGIEKDKAPIQAGLTWPVNNGMVEGFVNKLKLITRQAFGRASFPLLRQRVLHDLSHFYSHLSRKGERQANAVSLSCVRAPRHQYVGALCHFEWHYAKNARF